MVPSRGPLALSCLSLAPNGNLFYRLKQARADGTTHVVFTPRSFLVRLSWLCLIPRIHMTRYHGVFAPNHTWRNQIVPKPPIKLPNQLRCARNRHDWATMLRRVFALEVLLCAACGGQRRVISEIREGPVAKKILEHLGLPTEPPARTPAWVTAEMFPTGPPARGPPEPEPVMGGDLDLVADLRGLLARDVPLAFGFALPVRKTSYEDLGQFHRSVAERTSSPAAAARRA